MVLAGIQSDSIDAIVTDPPYGLGFGNHEWDSAVPGVEYWSAIIRAAKPGAYCLAFGGTRTMHRLAVAIEDAGWQIRDTLMWVYGGGFPKSRRLDGVPDHLGQCLRPAWEPIIMARKPLVGTLAANYAAHGLGGLQIEASRIPFLDPRDEKQTKSRNQHGKRGSKSRQNRIFGGLKGARVDYNPSGRWPANVATDGSEEVVGALPAGATRFFYRAKASQLDRNEGLPEGMQSTHPTVKPTALMAWWVGLVTPPDGTVLDPFCGTGSTGKAAVMLGRRFVGVDLSEEYLTIARHRLIHAACNAVATGVDS